jgi:nitrate reductase gamma subunit
MGIGFSLFAVVILACVALAGVGAARFHYLFGVVIPYISAGIFILGFIWRVVKWAASPVPFHITTTCGQQKSLPWIKWSRFENPADTLGVVVRMALEVFLFRSLFRNMKSELKDQKLGYGSAKWLWLAGLTFHYAFLTVLVRHSRFFTEPIPFFVKWIEELDGLFAIAVPTVYMTDVALVVAVTYLFLRRVVIPQLRYISLPADYFPLFLILGIAVTGIITRHFSKVDLLGVKNLAMGLFTFKPVVPEGIGLAFFVHLFLVCVLVAYFPFSKLMHMGGIFLSPTRNMTGDSRRKRHVNPWNYPVKVHTYEEYENEFRDKMIQAGLPVEKRE